MKHRLARLALAVVICAGCSGAVSGPADAPTERAPAAHFTGRVTSTLPTWLAPGARLRVAGFAPPRRRVELRANGRVVAAGDSGRLGGYSLSARIPRSGRYRISVRSSDGRYRARVGMLRVRPLELDAVGDVTFGEQVGPAVEEHGADYPWAHARVELAAADIATANLETAVSARGVAAAGKQYTFRGPPMALGGVARAGIDVLTLANNHSVDYGTVALEDTLRTAHADGLATVGAGADAAAARRPAIVEAGGLRVGFLGYSDVNPPGFAAGPSSPGTAPADPAAIAADVRALRRRVDLVVVWFHWGVELEREPDARQRELAAAALNAGAQVVLGAHPHVLQPIRLVSGRRLVAWSLGNFVFPSSSPGTESTGVLHVLLGRSGVRGYRLARMVAGVQPRPL